MVARGRNSLIHHNPVLLHCNSWTPLIDDGGAREDPGQDIVVYMEYINNVNYNWICCKWLLMEVADKSQDPKHWSI